MIILRNTCRPTNSQTLGTRWCHKWPVWSAPSCLDHTNAPVSSGLEIMLRNRSRPTTTFHHTTTRSRGRCRRMLPEVAGVINPSCLDHTNASVPSRPVWRSCWEIGPDPPPLFTTLQVGVGGDADGWCQSGRCDQPRVPRSHQRFRPIPSGLEIIMRNRSQTTTTFHHATSRSWGPGDGDGWCQKWPVWWDEPASLPTGSSVCSGRFSPFIGPCRTCGGLYLTRQAGRQRVAGREWHSTLAHVHFMVAASQPALWWLCGTQPEARSKPNLSLSYAAADPPGWKGKQSKLKQAT